MSIKRQEQPIINVYTLKKITLSVGAHIKIVQVLKHNPNSQQKKFTKNKGKSSVTRRNYGVIWPGDRPALQQGSGLLELIVWSIPLSS